MNDEPRQKLRELIVEHGRSLCNDPRRCEALLKDYCGNHKREISVLVGALKNRVVDDLLKSTAGVPKTMVLARLRKRLEDELAMTAEAAHWAVESWALALRFITVSPVVTPVTQLKTPTGALSGAPVASPSHQPEILLADRYLDNYDGTVTDVVTGLQWMRFSLGQEWSGGTCTGDTLRYTWHAALDAAQNLNRKGFAGHRDWRVPAKEELLSLVYCSSGLPKTWNDTGKICEGDFDRPTIDRKAFPRTPMFAFWSASSQTGNASYAWSVSFDIGFAHSGSTRPSASCMVRLVRSGQHVIKDQKIEPVVSPPHKTELLIAGRYRDNQDGTVTDATTGLQWMRFSLGQEWKGGACIGGPKDYQWQDALDASDVWNRKGGYAGHRDWRVPAKEELLSLVYCSSGLPKTWNDTGLICEGDYHRPTIDNRAFPRTRSSYYWTGSPFASDRAWYVSFDYGYYNYDIHASNGAVRLVRGG